MYGCAISIQKPILSVILSQRSLYCQTDSRHFLLNVATPYASISFLFRRPNAFSTCTSTGSPCVSQPARRGTKNPRMVLKRKIISLKDRASTWCTPGSPFAVGGPSKNTKVFLFFFFGTAFSKTLFFFQNPSISSSLNIKKV